MKLESRWSAACKVQSQRWRVSWIDAWLHGHNWVCLAWLAIPPMWGVIALPLLLMLYVRAVDVPPLAEKYSWE